MKKIALLMDSWKRSFTYAWPAGILRRIKEKDEDINLYIFNSSGNWSYDEAYNIGEYNIFHLPDLKEFDGIILDLNNIRLNNVLEYIINAAKETGKPVISIANEIDDFYYVGIDNYSAIRDIIEHLYKVHKAKTFWFVMGPADNYENNVRAQGLKDFMHENHLSFQESDFYYENYEYICGVNGFHTLMETHKCLPDAIVCANDNIVVGVCEAAAKMGFAAPKDFLITGFDDFDKASYYSPHITTVSHIREEVGARCVDMLCSIWNGEKVPRFNYTGTRPVYSESCGCTDADFVDMKEHSKNQIMYGIETDNFEEQMLALEYELMRCNSVSEMTNCIFKCIPSMKCDAMYLVLDEHMNEFKEKQPDCGYAPIEDEKFHTEGYPEKMLVELAYENGSLVPQKQIPIERLFPMFDTEESMADFLFMPIHFRSDTVGYFVIKNAVYLMEKQYLFQVVNALTSAMENLHRKEILEYMNRELSMLYIKDPMTSLYNRVGYQKLAFSLFEKRKQEKNNMIIMYIDMDRLKYINDKFGHEHGDFSIKAIGNAILRYAPQDSIAIRLGGDEFAVIIPKEDVRVAEALEEAVCRELRSVQVEKNLPYPLSVSIGYVRTDMSTEKELDDYVREADEMMYQKKVQHKKNRS